MKINRKRILIWCVLAFSFSNSHTQQFFKLGTGFDFSISTDKSYNFITDTWNANQSQLSTPLNKMVFIPGVFPSFGYFNKSWGLEINYLFRQMTQTGSYVENGSFNQLKSIFRNSKIDLSVSCKILNKNRWLLTSGLSSQLDWEKILILYSPEVPLFLSHKKVRPGSSVFLNLELIPEELLGFGFSVRAGYSINFPKSNLEGFFGDLNPQIIRYPGFPELDFRNGNVFIRICGSYYLF